MRKILFVDDELKILEGLERLLRPQRSRWDMTFAPGGEAAMKELLKAPFDVIVTDMSMPGMDGAKLLEEVHRRFPTLVRIVLSGHTDRDTVLRAVPVSHQFLSKPCDPDVLLEVVERACGLQSLLRKDSLRKVIGELTDLPSVPRIYSQLIQALGDHRTSLGQVAKIVEQDIALCARLLQLVNSSFFGLARRITNIPNAVSYLGMTMLKNLALSMEVFRKFEGRSMPSGFSLEALQDHALLTARLARKLLISGEKADDSFMAGMLHDVGKLILVTQLPDHLARAMDLAREKGCSLHAAEEEENGVTHAEVGAYLLGLWGLPYPIVEAVAFHHVPARVDHRSFDVLAAVHIANLLAHERAAPGHEDEGRPEAIDPGYLEGLGVLGKLPAWREEARGLPFPVAV